MKVRIFLAVYISGITVSSAHGSESPSFTPRPLHSQSNSSHRRHYSHHRSPMIGQSTSASPLRAELVMPPVPVLPSTSPLRIATHRRIISASTARQPASAPTRPAHFMNADEAVAHEENSENHSAPVGPYVRSGRRLVYRASTVRESMGSADYPYSDDERKEHRSHVPVGSGHNNSIHINITHTPPQTHTPPVSLQQPAEEPQLNADQQAAQDAAQAVTACVTLQRLARKYGVKALCGTLGAGALLVAARYVSNA